ncbi:GNAT family N-acetyltransferase [Bradyrhizobium sp. USDA 223]|uniref:GNAT family N-acetyltransferase n=1 Tax=Bradyrhizobium sp. USDA 223 TaxID=3156306 RepID=UPI0038397C03
MLTNYTERLILTSMRPEHEVELFKLHNDPLVQQMNFKNVAQTTQDVRKWLDWALVQWRKNRFGHWMVYQKSSDGPIFTGRCGLVDYESDLEFVCLLCEHAVGRGLGPEAASFAITHALRNSTKEKVVAFIAKGNVRSERAAKKLGLRYIDDRQYEHDGSLRQYYEVTRQEYFSRHQSIAAG